MAYVKLISAQARRVVEIARFQDRENAHAERDEPIL
jgi:hypothetical protein